MSEQYPSCQTALSRTVANVKKELKSNWRESQNTNLDRSTFGVWTNIISAFDQINFPLNTCIIEALHHNHYNKVIFVPENIGRAFIRSKIDELNFYNIETPSPILEICPHRVLGIPSAIVAFGKRLESGPIISFGKSVIRQRSLMGINDDAEIAHKLIPDMDSLVVITDKFRCTLSNRNLMNLQELLDSWKLNVDDKNTIKMIICVMTYLTCPDAEITPCKCSTRPHIAVTRPHISMIGKSEPAGAHWRIGHFKRVYNRNHWWRGHTVNPDRDSKAPREKFELPMGASTQ